MNATTDAYTVAQDRYVRVAQAILDRTTVWEAAKAAGLSGYDRTGFLDYVRSTGVLTLRSVAEALALFTTQSQMNRIEAMLMTK